MFVDREPVTTVSDVLAEAIRLGCEPSVDVATGSTPNLTSALIDPQQVQEELKTYLGPRVGRASVTGSLGRRLVFIERGDGRWVVADLSNRPHATRDWPAWARDHIKLDDPLVAVSLASLSGEAVHRLSR